MMAGCREEDQKAYHGLVERMKGVNLAEHFGKADKQTCFGTQKCWRSNDGQRIDHMIADGELLNDSRTESGNESESDSIRCSAAIRRI